MDTSGWFEVEILSKGGSTTLIHSMKGGDGFADTDAKLQRVLSGIAAAAK